MATNAITVEDVSKRYLIAHRTGQEIISFRDLLVGTGRRIIDRVRGTTAAQPAHEAFWALRNIDLAIPEGEVVGIIGRNGAGKSTLLKILSRITAPTEGRIRFRGRVASLLEVGTGFHPELTGRENVYLNGAILGMSKAEIRRKFDDIVAFAEVERFLDTPVKRYSSGMYIRLAFSVAAHLEPDILIVDEVLAVGDSAFQKKCLGRMQQVATREQRTVLFVSHNMQAVQSLCTRAVYLKNGRIETQGGVRDVVGAYLASLSSTQSNKVWPDDAAPGNDYARLHEIAILRDGHFTGTYPSSAPLHVEMDFTIRTAHPELSLGFDLMNSEGITVLRSYQTDGPQEQWPSLAPGRHRLRCTIPAGLLNGGLYYLSPRIGLHNIAWIYSEDAVAQFEVVLDHSTSPMWSSTTDARPGLVAPVLPWKTVS